MKYVCLIINMKIVFIQWYTKALSCLFYVADSLPCSYWTRPSSAVSGSCYRTATCWSSGCDTWKSRWRSWPSHTQTFVCGWPPSPRNTSPSASCRGHSRSDTEGSVEFGSILYVIRIMIEIPILSPYALSLNIYRVINLEIQNAPLSL